MNTVDLQRILLFKDMSEPVLKAIARIAEEVSFSAGEQIAGESEPAKALILIRSGTVRAAADGKPPVTFGSGEAIGQMSLLDGGPAGMTAVAVERVDAFAIRPQRLAAELGANHELAHQFYRAIARSLAARLRRAAGAIASERTGS